MLERGWLEMRTASLVACRLDKYSLGTKSQLQGSYGEESDWTQVNASLLTLNS